MEDGGIKITDIESLDKALRLALERVLKLVLELEF